MIKMCSGCFPVFISNCGSIPPFNSPGAIYEVSEIGISQAIFLLEKSVGS